MNKRVTRDDDDDGCEWVQCGECKATDVHASNCKKMLKKDLQSSFDAYYDAFAKVKQGDPPEVLVRASRDLDTACEQMFLASK